MMPLDIQNDSCRQFKNFKEIATNFIGNGLRINIHIPQIVFNLRE